MPNCNPGFDFLCGRGFKIDVKSSCLGKTKDGYGSWHFSIKKNKTADYFLCLAFDNRESLNPMHVWLIPGQMVNDMRTIYIPNSDKMHRWGIYERPLDRVLGCCDKMTQLVMSTMSQFGMTMQDTGKIADVFAKGAAGSAAGLGDYAQAMEYVGPVAKATGVSLESTVAMISKVRDAGIDASTAGTAMRSSFLQLAKPTKAINTALKGIGLTYEDVNPRTHSFIDTLDLLKSKGADAFTLEALFGKESVSVVQTLMNVTDETRAFTEELEGSSGVARTMADLKLDSLAMDLEAAKGAASDLAIGIGEKLEPAARSMLQGFSDVEKDARVQELEAERERLQSNWRQEHATAEIWKEDFRKMKKALQESELLRQAQYNQITANNARIKELEALNELNHKNMRSWLDTTTDKEFLDKLQSEIGSKDAYIRRLEAAFLRSNAAMRYYQEGNRGPWPQLGEKFKEPYQEKAREALEKIKEGGKYDDR